MNLDRLRRFCLSLPDSTEQIQWGSDLVFKIGGKMFCVACTEPASAPVIASFKCEPDTFARLTEREGLVPAPYLARAMWVGLERFDALDDEEWRALVTRSYELVRAKLPKKKKIATEAAKKKKKKIATKAAKITKKAR